MKEKIRDNREKIKQNKVLPYLVGNVVELGGGSIHGNLDFAGVTRLLDGLVDEL